MNKLLLFFILFSSSVYASNWECINKSVGFCNTWRMEIPEGYIVASDNSATGGEHGYGMVFVPDEKHQWKVD